MPRKIARKAVEPLQVPHWVPEAAAGQAHKIFKLLIKEGASENALAKVSRLACDQRMKTVWEELRKKQRENYRRTERPKHPVSAQHVFSHWGTHLYSPVTRHPKFLSLNVPEPVVRRLFAARELGWSSPAFGHFVQEVMPAKFFQLAAMWAVSGIRTLSPKEADDRRRPLRETVERLRQDAREPMFTKFRTAMNSVAEAYEVAVENGIPEWLIVTRERSSPELKGFILTVGYENWLLFNSRLDGTIATVANVVFDRKVMNADAVRRMFSRSHPAFKKEK